MLCLYQFTHAHTHGQFLSIEPAARYPLPPACLRVMVAVQMQGAAAPTQP